MPQLRMLLALPFITIAVEKITCGYATVTYLNQTLKKVYAGFLTFWLSEGSKKWKKIGIA